MEFVGYSVGVYGIKFFEEILGWFNCIWVLLFIVDEIELLGKFFLMVVELM